MSFLRGYAAFLDYRYWLNLRPVPLGPSLVGGIVTFFFWFLTASIALRLVAHALRKKEPLRTDLLRRFARPLSTCGFLGLLFLLFTYEQVPLLGMRLWFLLISLLLVASLGRVALYLVKEYPVLQREVEERRRIEKYLPKRK